MIVFYLFLLAILLATYACVLSRVKRHSAGLTPLLGWLIGLGFFLLAPLAILTLHGGFRQPAVYDFNGSWDEVNLSNPIFFRPYLIVWMGSLLALVPVFLMVPPPTRATVAGDCVLSRRSLERVLLATMALMVVDWTATIHLAGGFAGFLVSHWYARTEAWADELGRGYVLYTHLSLTNSMIFTAAAALHTSQGLEDRAPRWAFTAPTLAFFAVQIVMSGNRIFFALYLLALATSALLYGRRKILMAMFVASPVLIFVFSAWTSVRAHVGDIPDSLSKNVLEVDIGNTAVTHSMNVTEGMAVMLLMHMINDFGTKFPYLEGGTYGRLLTFFFPQSMAAGRPPDFSTLSAQLYEPGRITSLGSTALGEAYANFALAGVLVMPALTWLSVRCTAITGHGGGKHGLLSALGFVMFVCFVRFPFAENALTLMAAASLIWLFRAEPGLGLREPGVQEAEGR